MRTLQKDDNLPEVIASPIVREEQALRPARSTSDRSDTIEVDMAWTSTASGVTGTPSLSDFIDARQLGTSSYPHIAGQSTFYEALQTFPWDYVPWKWEHEIAKSCLGWRPGT